MTRLGFYIIHNNRYKLVKKIDVPWDFIIGAPDNKNGEEEAKKKPSNSDIPPDFEELYFERGCDDNEEEDIPKSSFEEWFMEYFYYEIMKDETFFDVFNTNRTYIIISEEDPSVMGFMITHKGKTMINFKEHDYRNIINTMFPNIRKDMITKDESFGGYDEDSDFSKDDCPLITDDSKEYKGIDTYPNFF